MFSSIVVSVRNYNGRNRTKMYGRTKRLGCGPANNEDVRLS